MKEQNAEITYDIFEDGMLYININYPDGTRLPLLLTKEGAETLNEILNEFLEK